MPTLYLLDVPEFSGAVNALEKEGQYRIDRANGYVRVESDTEIVVERARTEMNEAVWFGLTVAGFDGSIDEFTSDRLRIAAAAGMRD